MAGVVGAAGALATWMAAVPWDLTDGGERTGGPPVGIVAAAAVAALAGLVIGQVPRLRRRVDAAVVTAAGTVTWALLFAWRVGAAHADQPAVAATPLVLFVLPSAIALPLAVATMTDWATRQRAVASPDVADAPTPAQNGDERDPERVGPAVTSLDDRRRSRPAQPRSVDQPGSRAA